MRALMLRGILGLILLQGCHQQSSSEEKFNHYVNANNVGSGPSLSPSPIVNSSPAVVEQGHDQPSTLVNVAF